MLCTHFFMIERWAHAFFILKPGCSPNAYLGENQLTWQSSSCEPLFSPFFFFQVDSSRNERQPLPRLPATEEVAVRHTLRPSFHGGRGHYRVRHSEEVSWEGGGSAASLACQRRVLRCITQAIKLQGGRGLEGMDVIDLCCVCVQVCACVWVLSLLCMCANYRCVPRRRSHLSLCVRRHLQRESRIRVIAGGWGWGERWWGGRDGHYGGRRRPPAIWTELPFITEELIPAYREKWRQTLWERRWSQHTHYCCAAATINRH